ncbi:MAG TPA: hypothetical protein VI316_03325 [Candidatus Dormibacteraeota bacterium]
MRIPHLALAGATLATALTLVASSITQAAVDPATHALQYLAGQQGADGSIAGHAGPTEDAIIGAADAGYDPATLVPPSGTSAFAYLTAQTVAGKADSSAGATAKLILAVVAGHLDPSGFAGKDLVAELLGAAQFDSTSGRFDPGAPNTFSQALGTLALQAAGQAVPAAAVTALLAMQRNDDHGWGYDGSAFTTRSDSNSTALALQALAAVGQASGTALTGALGYLHALQGADGGFGFDVASPSDPNSDALVIQGLVAVGEDPAAAAWTRARLTVVSNLLSFQDAATGGFHALGATAPDAFTTSQIPSALARRPYGSPTSFTPGTRVPPLPAPTPAPPPTAVPTPTAGVAGVAAAPSTGGGPVAGIADENSGISAGEIAVVMSLLGAGGAALVHGRRRRG